MAAPDWWRNWNRQRQDIRDPTPVNTNNLPIDQLAWLATEPHWQNRVGAGWVAKKVLGAGGFGIVGHWRYEGLDRRSRNLVDIAIKQAVLIDRMGIHQGGLTTEAEFLQLLAKAQSPHVVRVYKTLQEDQGRGAVRFDNGIVQRLLMEFCPGGDGHKLIYGAGMRKTVPEALCWAVFHCVARGLCVVDRGTEDPDAARWGEAEIVHFDLKLINLLIGLDVADEEHRDNPAYKIADFGLALRVPATPNLGFSIRNHARGTQFVLVPEQVRNKRHQDGERPWTKDVYALDPPDVQFGARCNIWQLGLVMWELMNAPFGRSIEQDGWHQMACYRSTMSPRLLSGGETVGCQIDIDTDAQDGQEYSRLLRTAVAECLLIDGSKRPTTLELFEMTKNGLDTERMSQGSVFAYQQFPPYSEPPLSAQWYTEPAKPPPLVPAATPISARRKQEQEQIAQKAADLALRRSIERKAALDGIIANTKTPPPAPGIAIPLELSRAQALQDIADDWVEFSSSRAEQEKDNLRVKQPLSQQPLKSQLQNQTRGKSIRTNPIPSSNINSHLQERPSPPLPNAKNTPLTTTSLAHPSTTSLISHPRSQTIHPLPPSLHFILVRKPAWLGKPITKNYTLDGIKPSTPVSEVKRRLEERDGVVKREKMLMRNGREVMDDGMLMGHFRLRRIVRVREL